MDPAGWAATLEASGLGAWMRGSTWAYPAVNVLHLFGLVALVGPILLLDLRLLGFGRGVALAPAMRVLTAWAVAGLAMLVASGIALLSADARALVANPALQVKLALIAVAITNALVFRVRWSRRTGAGDAPPPAVLRLQAALSLVLWLAVPVAGRLIAYV
jgi:hypothetical protein